MFLNGPSINSEFVPVDSTSYGLTSGNVSSPQGVTLMTFDIANGTANPNLYTNTAGLITFLKSGSYAVDAIFTITPTTAGVAPKQEIHETWIVKNAATTNIALIKQSFINNGLLTFPSPASPGPYGTTISPLISVHSTFNMQPGDTIGIYQVGVHGDYTYGSGNLVLYVLD